jgi:hypothetical protein
MQVDIGFGDAVIPAPTTIDFPVLLDLPAPRLRAYRRETVVAEKFNAMVQLGIGNSRMKDFFDLRFLARTFEFDGDRSPRPSRRHSPAVERRYRTTSHSRSRRPSLMIRRN